jgi:hypothetical protein
LPAALPAARELVDQPNGLMPYRCTPGATVSVKLHHRAESHPR